MIMMMEKKYFKDGINDFIIHQSNTINPQQEGTKAAANYNLKIDAGQNISLRFRLSKNQNDLEDFDDIFKARINEVDIFYKSIQKGVNSPDALAFHCMPYAILDAEFAKNQLLLLTKEWYIMHPNGHIPAYEWDFSDANPPVHALAAWIIYYVDKQNCIKQGGQV